MKYSFDISPCPAPRMSQRDRWKPSRAAQKYFSFRNHLVYLANLKSLYALPGTINSLIFYMPMPASWSNKKKAEMNGKPHQSNIDLDNITKGFFDALCSNDQHIHSIGNLRKIWSYEGSIELTIGEPEPEAETLSLFEDYGTNR